jgi:AmpD protein
MEDIKMYTKLLLISTLLFQPPHVTKKLLPGKTLRDTTKNYIVIHNDGGNLGASSTRLVLRLRGLSYHYFITKTGTLYQFKDLKYTASHAGASKFLGLEGWNKFSIGVCLQGSDETDYTPEQYATLNKLVKYIHTRYPDSMGKPLVSHSDIAYPYGRKVDPGKHFDFTKLGKEGA